MGLMGFEVKGGGAKKFLSSVVVDILQKGVIR